MANTAPTATTESVVVSAIQPIATMVAARPNPAAELLSHSAG